MSMVAIHLSYPEINAQEQIDRQLPTANSQLPAANHLKSLAQQSLSDPLSDFLPQILRN